MRKITKADAIKDKKASTRATTREIMFFKLVARERKICGYALGRMAFVKRYWHRQQLNAAAKRRVRYYRLFGLLFGHG